MLCILSVPMVAEQAAVMLLRGVRSYVFLKIPHMDSACLFLRNLPSLKCAMSSLRFRALNLQSPNVQTHTLRAHTNFPYLLVCRRVP